jgi:DUF2914 family protein
MRKYWPAVLMISAAMALPAASTAQDATQAGAAKAAVTVEAAVGTSVADKALVGAAESFPATSGKIACFAHISNAVGSEIEFVWYKGDAEQARVKQTVKGSPYRTWTTKTLPADAKGDWRCDVVQGEKVLQSVKFKVE